MNTTSGQGPGRDDEGGDEIFAAEYVLGLLDAASRARAQARIAAEPAFAREVAAWEERFAPWLGQVPAAEVPAHLWPRIRTRLGWPSVEKPRLWNNTAFWRAATGLAVAASVAAVVVSLRAPEPQAPVVVEVPVPVQEEEVAKPVAVLAQDDGRTRWLASIDAARGKLLMVPVPTPADAGGLVHELWIIPPGQAPISLGFVSNEKAHTIAIPDAVRRALAVGATLAVTLEPQAGMPHAAPSGPVVAKGGILQI